MKIGFNGRFLLEPHTGIGQYTVNLLTAMAKQDKTIEWVVAIPKKLPKGVQLPKTAKIVILPEKSCKNASLQKMYWEQVQVPRLFKKEKVNIAHYPYPSNPRLPGLKSPKTIVTVHDAIPWTNPKYRHRLRTRLYQRNAKKALQKADHLIAVSQTTAFAISDHIKFPFNKISVIHEAASPEFKKKTSPNRNKNPFFLYVGGYDERKNVIRLVEAFQEYVAPQFAVDLILVGAKNRSLKHYTTLDRLQKTIKSSKIKDLHKKMKGSVKKTPSLPIEKLAKYYAAAHAYVNVSLEEGFNIPPLEASAQGIPLILSDIPINREIIEKNGLFCDPKSTKHIGETLLHFLRDKSLRNDLQAATKTLNKKYTWEKAAQKTLELYQ